MKTALKIFLLLGLTVYLIFAVTKFNKPDPNQRCTQVLITIADSNKVGFINSKEVADILTQNKIKPLGQKMSDIDSRRIEAVLKKNPFIDSVVCYKTPADILRIDVTQLHPVLRVMAANGDDYYLSAQGTILPRLHYTADLVVATGNISKSYAQKKLAPLGDLLQNNPFWNDQIVQFNVDDQGNIEFVTRVGNQLVYLGSPEEVDTKLANLKKFYEKVLSQVGWNKYSRINLEYVNQIICTKK